ncbi:unnamed protein product [Protopolystoma xenopodis]|uniref:Uncharacterized protein n=1 Tax=Protopolystoma xenopodis TaxID=117903 RepID=A0A448WID7_9PLAT|nr:unnamed protein product [Protopolystoma xenopodis]
MTTSEKLRYPVPVHRSEVFLPCEVRLQLADLGIREGGSSLSSPPKDHLQSVLCPVPIRRNRLPPKTNYVLEIPRLGNDSACLQSDQQKIMGKAVWMNWPCRPVTGKHDRPTCSSVICVLCPLVPLSGVSR